jgi:hypothetical protein
MARNIGPKASILPNGNRGALPTAKGQAAIAPAVRSSPDGDFIVRRPPARSGGPSIKPEDPTRR